MSESVRESGGRVDVTRLPEGDEEEAAKRELGGRLGLALSVGAALLSLYALLQVFRPAQDGVQFYLSVFLAGALPLTFLLFPARRGAPQGRPSVVDWALAVVAALVCLYPVLTGFDGFLDRQGLPNGADQLAALALLLLLVEATRRTTGWVLPVIAGIFLVYAYFGSELPVGFSLSHAGFELGQIANSLYMGTSGFFGTPLAVAASYIVLFTVYGAVLNVTGAGKFFVDLSFAAFRGSAAAPGRTVTMAGFLLGTVSGSGAATAVTLGTVSWPILKRGGYPPEPAAGVLAAAGIGAILSPPTLGAAAFIIAEFLGVSYLTVLLYATVPTLLYYLGIFCAVEIDARKHRTEHVDVDTPPARRLLLRFGYHFLSLIAIIVFLALGLSAFRAVVYATGLALLLSFLDPAHRITPSRLLEALASGARGALAVIATCAIAGVIVAVTTLTGLGLNLAGIIVDVGGAISSDATIQLLITCLLAAMAVTLLGLAVPVTASFIIAAVVIGPALTELGVSRPEAYMFIFYFAVLSEVSPPTALAAVAASAITGGDAIRSMIQTLKYSLPAFLVPFAFVLTDNGSALLGQASLPGVILATLVAGVAVLALAVVAGGWMLGPTGRTERLLCVPAALLLLYLAPLTVGIGLACFAVAIAVHLVRRRRQPAPEPAMP